MVVGAREGKVTEGDSDDAANAGQRQAGLEGAYFRAATEAAQVGIYVLQDRLFKYVNPCLTELFGYTAEEMLDGMGPLDLVPAEQHPFL